MNTNSPAPLRSVRLDIIELEIAFESATDSELGAFGDTTQGYLDLETGRIVWPETDEEVEALFHNERFLKIPTNKNRTEFCDLEDFVATLEDGPRRRELSKAIQGRGAFRRFKAIVHGSGDIELRHAWNWFETRRLRERIVAWLAAAGIEPQWEHDILKPPALPDRRPELLRAVLEFVRRAGRLEGVRSIALLGSLATDKSQPKDVDLLAIVEDAIPLGPLAKSARQLQGKAMQTGDSRGADVFLANPAGDYIGRTCTWKECRPGIRQACEAQHCGRREFLYDDLQNVRLEREIIARPPIQLWPNAGPRDSEVSIPHDVAKILLAPLKTEQA